MINIKVEDKFTRDSVNKKKFPEYVRLENTEMRLENQGGLYYRDAGRWSIKAKWQKGKLVAIGSGPTKKFKGVEFEVISEEEWKKGNRGYV